MAYYSFFVLPDYDGNYCTEFLKLSLLLLFCLFMNLNFSKILIKHNFNLDKFNGNRPPLINVDPPITEEKKESHSWLYSLCMRCRVTYETESWEPRGWATVCPFPYCPPYRQFARLFSLILFGKYLVFISRSVFNLTDKA